MANGIQGIRSLPLHDLIGAALVAIIQADAEAAKATLEYIETVGFKASGGDADSGASIAAGDLRMAEFKYKKLDENNDVAEFVASVPVLSLVPIPALQVKDAKFKFSAQITDISKEESKPAASAGLARNAAVLTNIGSAPLVSKLRATPYNLVAKPVASSGAKDQEVRGNFHLEIEVSMGQADLPLGMEKLFNLMDQAIQDGKTPKEG